MATWQRIAIALAVLLAAIGTLAPLAATLAEHAPRARDLDAALASVARGATLAVIAAALATAFAWPLARALPPILLLGWAMIGSLPRSLGVLALGVPPGRLAVILATASGMLPWIALLLQLRLRGIPRAWLEAAADLGAGPWSRWRRIELPLARAAIGFGALWGALQCLGDVTTWELAGGGKVFSAALLLRDAVLVDDAPALAATLVATLLAFGAPAAVWVASQSRRLVAAVGNEPPPPSATMRHVGVTLAVIAALPVLALVPDAFAPITSADALLAARLGPTVIVLVATAIVGVAIGAMASIAAGARRTTITAIVLMPLVMPTTVYGIAALELGRALGLSPGLLLTVLGALPTAAALGYIVTALALPRVPASLLEAAANLGAGPWQRARTIWIPRLAPAWLAGAVLVAAWSLAEATIPAFTSGPGGSTIAIAMTIVARGAEAHVLARWALLQAIVVVLAVVTARWSWSSSGARKTSR
jgi:ABC-type spermidine/putrescine transport system permease subunit II